MTIAFPSDPFAAVTHPDPYPYYAALRRDGSLHRDERLGLWVVVGAGAIEQALREPHARVRPPDEPVPRFLLGSRAGDVFAALARMNDGPRHSAQRARVEALLAPLGIDRWAEEAQATVRALAGAWSTHADVDALDHAVRWLPTWTVSALLGVPEPDRPAIASWAATWVAGLAPGADSSARGAAIDAMETLLDRLRTLGIGDVDVDSAAAHVALLMQAHDATAGLIGAGLLRLARDPQLRAAARSEGFDWNAFGAEVLRHDPPIQNTRRSLAADVRIEGRTVPAGDTLLLVLGAAGRDPARHPEPDAFRLDRQPSSCGLGLGAGAHRCPGGDRALALAIAAWRELTRSASDGALAALAERVRWRPSSNARMPVFGSS